MAKQDTTFNVKLSENDKSYIGKYQTVTGAKFDVMMDRYNGRECLTMANEAPFFSNRAFHLTSAKELQEQIEAKLINKI
jgi:hypothetical protein